MRAIDVRSIVRKAMEIDGSVSRLRIEVPGLYLRYLAPRTHRRRRHILPTRAIITRHVNEPVVRAHPNRLGIKRGRANRVHHAKTIRHRLVDIPGRYRIERLRQLRMQARQIRTDLRPRLPAIARTEYELICIVK